MTPDEEFEDLRPLLFAIAYRIPESSPTRPTSTKAFLSAVVTRISIDVLRSARVRREMYVGQWFPEPLLTDPYEDPARSAELGGHGVDGGPVAAPTADPDALRDGDVDGMRVLLAADVQMVGDGGGKAPALARGVVGANNVARLIASTFPVLVKVDARLEPREVNGQPGAILRDRDGKVAGTMMLDVLGGRIQTIRWVDNPDKLGHLGPVADAWAIAREVKQARRIRD